MLARRGLTLVCGALCALTGPSASAEPSVARWVATSTQAEGVRGFGNAFGEVRTGDPEAALRVLEGADPRDASVALLRARAHAALGDREAALAALDAARPTPNLCGARDLLAEALVEARAGLLWKTDRAAAAKLELELPPDGVRLGGLHRSMKAAGHDALSLRAARRLLVEVPEHPQAVELAEAFGPKGLAELLGTVELRLARVRALLETHQSEAAVREARALAAELGPKSARACELGYVEGKALRKLRSYRPAQAALSRARKLCKAAGEIDFALRAALLETRVRNIRGQVKGTLRLAQWIEEAAPEHSYVDDAWWMHAATLERRGKDAEAKAVLQKIAERSDADHAPEAAWRLAFAAIRAGDGEGARPYLDAILDNPGRPMARARALYWRAELARRAGDREAARKDFEALVLEPSFYGWMALDRLAAHEPKWVKAWKTRLLELRSAPDVEISASALGPAKAAVRDATRLIRVDHEDWAWSEIDKVACQVKTDAGRRALSAAYLALGFAAEAQRIARARQPKWRGGPVTAETVRDWRIAYSRAFEPAVRYAAEAERVEPLLLTALSREESTFDPEIVSWAGAVGLTQLMPATAIGAYADVYRRRLKRLERLTDPGLNLRLGAHVLGQNLRGFRRAEPLALAAYNGGPGLARRFVPDAATPFDEWVETLTVKETRRYIKRVTETWGIYRWLYDPDAPFVDLPDAVGGPEWKRR